MNGLGPPDFALEPRGPFTLASAARFIAGWPPTAAGGQRGDGLVRLAFAADDWSGHAGVVLRQEADHGPVELTIVESSASDRSACATRPPGWSRSTTTAPPTPLSESATR